MLKSKYSCVKWNARNKKYYENLGYNFTKMGDEFEVDVHHLSKGFMAVVEIQCDYCNKIYKTKFDTYSRLKNKDVVYSDCCGNIECTTKKSKEVMIKKYGVSNCRNIDGVNEKIQNTNIKKYGHENPFRNKEIQNKIKYTNMLKYGVEHNSHSEIVNKKRSESMKSFYINNPNKKLIGEKNPRWIKDSEYKRNIRSTNEYNIWRNKIFDKYDYTCQCCGMKRIKNSQQEINAHHIKNLSDNIDLAFDENNGIVLCEICHNKFHSIYGKHNNNEKQLQDFLLVEKIC